jgi:hypothetical protein
MKYIAISFLPGSAGNFFTRCLNLLTGACYFVDKTTKKLPTTIEEKLSILNYNNVINKSFDQRDWVTFEHQLIKYFTIRPHHELPSNSYSIWSGHPIHSYGLANLDDLAGPDDQCYRFYIDPGEHFEWCVLNALYKNSYIDVKYFINGKKLLDDCNTYKIKLDSFIQGWKPFYKEFEKACNYIEHNLTNEEIQAIQTLYTQWRTTVLEYKDLELFKTNIGFNM